MLYKYLTKRKTIISKFSDSDLIFIEKNYGQEINELNPLPSQRIKYELYGKPNHLCSCGNFLKFSTNAGEIFRNSCGNQKCAAKTRDIKSYEHKFKNSIETRKNRKPKFHYTNEQIKSFIEMRLSKNNDANYITSCDDDISIFIKKTSKNLNMKISQYCYHIYNAMELVTPKCPHEKEFKYLSFKKGYSASTRCCDYKAGNSRKVNKVIQLLGLFINSNFNVLENNCINDNSWKLECKKCSTIFRKWMNNGTRPDNILCPRCFPVNKSKMEFDLIEFIKSVYSGEMVHTYQLINTKYKNGVKSIDIYLPEISLGIELNGLFWHKDDSKRHLEKYLSCRELGITLLQFTDDDIKNRLNIVHSMIKNKMKLNTKIYARNCVIKEIDVKTCKKFCENNHIKGYSNSKIKLGMFHLGDLVSVFTVSKSRFEDDENELIRYCTLLDTTVVGGLSKFNAYLKKNTDIVSYITYADLHYGTGDSYSRVGMSLMCVTKPNYYYIVDNQLISRQVYQKHKLKTLLPEYYSPELTEKKIMEMAGISRYYDCGNLKLRCTLK